MSQDIIPSYDSDAIIEELQVKYLDIMQTREEPNDSVVDDADDQQVFDEPIIEEYDFI